MVEPTRPIQARDKLTFLLSLVPYLMDKESVTVQAAAAHFGVPDGQVRDAVRLIAVSGIPGDTAAYQHDDLFDIAWDDFEDNDQIVLTNMVAIDDSPRLSGREAAALIAGLQYLSALPEISDRVAIAALMAKLARGASQLPSAVAVEASESDVTVTLIRDAVSAGYQLEFDYLNARGEHERRRVDPLRVESVDADWYLRGWCHLREAPRTFRIDRMGNPSLTLEKITFHPQDVSLPETLFEGSPDDLVVSLALTPAAATLIQDYLLGAIVTPGTSGLVEASIRVSHPAVVQRLVGGHPGLVTVIGPPHVRDSVAEWALAGARQYDTDGTSP